MGADGQAAPPPPGGPPPAYPPEQQQADQAYGSAYSAWAAQNCMAQQQQSTASGAAIGGVLGVAAGAALGHSPGAAAVGGVLGVATGAAIGASNAGSCPPGYMIRAGAPPFAYAEPYYAPPWYQPWVWVDGAWYYYPYGMWYWRTYRPYYIVRGPRRAYPGAYHRHW